MKLAVARVRAQAPCGGLQRDGVLVARLRRAEYRRDAIGLVELARGEERFAESESRRDVGGREAVGRARELQRARRVVHLGGEVRGLQREGNVARRDGKSGGDGGERGVAIAGDLEHDGSDEVERGVAWRRAQCTIEAREGEVRSGGAHPYELRQVAVRVGVGGPKRDRLLESLLGLVEATLRLQRAREHEARLRRGDSQGDGAACRGLRFGRVAEVALRRREVMPCEAVVGVAGERCTPARGVRGSIGHAAFCNEKAPAGFAGTRAGFPGVDIGHPLEKWAPAQ